MKKIIYTLFIIHCSLFIVEAQVQQEWVRRYDDSAHLNDNTGGIALDRNGNIYVTGTGNSGANVTTIKYSPSGVQQWVAVYYGNGGDLFTGIVVDSAGNAYVRSTIGNFVNGIYSFLLLKYDTYGFLQWSKTYGDNTHSFAAEDVIIDRQGNIYEVGQTNAFGNVKVLIVKYTPNGDTIWTRTFAQPGYNLNYAFSIAIDSTNSLVIAGDCVLMVGAQGDCLVIKYSSSGNFLWSSVYNSGALNTNDSFYKVGVDNNGNVYATGIGGYWGDYLTIKYNSTGVQQWLQRYRGTEPNGSNYAASLVIDRQGYIYITGTCQNLNTGFDCASVKYNSNGDTLWVRIYDDPSHNGDGAYDIKLDSLQNIYINGFSEDVNNVDSIITIKYNNEGVQQWVMNYPGTPKWLENSVAIDRQYNVYVLGDNSLGGTRSDYITIKYSQLAGINPISNKIPARFELYQNFPNPFNTSTKIKYDIAKSSNVTLKVYDILGKEVQNLVNEKQPAGEYQIEWDGSNYSSGIYFYTLYTGNNILTRKMILLK